MEDAFLGRLMGTAYGMALYPSQRHLDVLSRFVTQTHQDVTARWIDQLMWEISLLPWIATHERSFEV
jgi:hypothetical protein